MPEKRILLIHPYDKSTLFLDRIKNHILLEFDQDVHYYSVKPNEESHIQCLNLIQTHPSKGLIIFLGHGRSDKLYGSKADDYSDLISKDAALEFPEKYYYNDNFINEDNINVFNKKKVFCLACNSAEKIAQYAYEKGATTFLGFGDIPTSQIEFKEKGYTVNESIVGMIKGEFNYIIKSSLAYALRRNLSFDNLMHILHFITNQRITDLLIKQKDNRARYFLANQLYFFKKEAQIIGERNLKVLE
jgi:hypothetical protein